MASVIYWFEAYSLDVDRRELRSDAGLHPLEPQVFDLLEYLVRHRDRVVSRDELFNAVWQGRLVSEASLSTRLNAVRCAIGDSGREQRLIRTFRGKGLRFVGAVREELKAVNVAPRSAAEAEHRAWMLQERPALAVLPFANLSGNPRQESVADGFTENLITSLAQTHWLWVASRSSSFAYKGKAIETTRIARKLHVRYVLEGSLRMTDGRLRLSVHLVDGLTGYQLWSKSYDVSAAPRRVVHDDLVQQVAAAIEPQLYLSERLGAERKPLASLNTWERMVRALSLMNSKDRRLVGTARQLMQRAVVLDPSSAQANSLLSFITTLGVHQGWRRRTREIPLALQIARNALALNVDEPWAHLALGYARIWVRPEEAIAELLNALSRDPNVAVAHYLIALASAWAGQGASALGHADMADHLSPRDLLARGNTGANNNVRATACFAIGRHREGIGFARKAIIDSPSMPTAYRAFLINAALAGDTAEARAGLRTVLRLAPNMSWGWIRETSVWGRDEDRRKYVEAFRAAGLK